MEKQFIALYTPEAEKDLKILDKQNIKKVFRTVGIFECLGKESVNSRPLNNQGLFELKCDKIRIYFMYYKNKIIIIVLIVLNKTQMAPDRYKTRAIINIENFIRNFDDEK